MPASRTGSRENLKKAILKTAEMIGTDEKAKDSIKPKEEEAIWIKLRSAAAIVTNRTP